MRLPKQNPRFGIQSPEQKLFFHLMPTPPSLDNLIREFSGLPGIGRKSARRIAYHVLGLSLDSVQDLTRAITEAKEASAEGPK